jgi:hypothetical protein
MLPVTWNYMFSVLEIAFVVTVMILSISKLVSVYVQRTPAPSPRKEDITPYNSSRDTRVIARKRFVHDHELNTSSLETFFRAIERHVSR